MGRLPPFFSEGRGKARIGDRRVLSGIVFIKCKGFRWYDAPKEYGPPKTLCNRWKGWSDKGVFARMMEGVGMMRERVLTRGSPRAKRRISATGSGRRWVKVRWQVGGSALRG